MSNNFLRGFSLFRILKVRRERTFVRQTHYVLVFVHCPKSCTLTFAWGSVSWAHSSPQYNGISIGSALFLGQADRQTDRHATRSITIGRIYVRSTAMRPNNINNYILRES